MTIPARIAAILLPVLVAGCAAPGAADRAGSLGGTAWQAIRLSDGTVPDDPSRLTVVFGADGRAIVRADCNRGSGTWQSSGPGRLTFGPVATTKMGCPPGSLGDRFLADLTRAGGYSAGADRLEIAIPNASGRLVLRPARAQP
ncbi:hypothetical protein STVA_18890 [Allostella vacuolata]|nr:hypothetical protein STVA_18890 [Stella vacuolata]